MIRKIIKIDEDLCNGCGLCADACHEGAIQMVDGKAKLIRDDYCDGLGDCLPVCPTNAISFEEREAKAFDKEAVEKHLEQTKNKPDVSLDSDQLPCGCPSAMSKTIKRQVKSNEKPIASHCESHSGGNFEEEISNLVQWPVQIRLVPSTAGFLDGAHLLVAADCAAYAHPSFNSTFMKDKITLIGCPKLDPEDYSGKLGEILENNEIKSLTVVKMEVPCCGSLASAAFRALENSGKNIPLNLVTLGTDGSCLGG